MKKEEVANYVRNRNKKLTEYNFQHFSVIITDFLPDNIDIRFVFKEIESLFPEHFLELIDVIYVGDFSFFKSRKINAMYSDGAMYLSNSQDNHDDIKDDIVHELAHAIEDKYGDYLYYDDNIKEEYFSKLKKLKNYLSFENYDFRGIDFFNEEYNSQFDEFLMNAVGYERLSNFTKNIFLSPYSATSLRENFAVGFEEFFIGDRVYLKSLCPYLYNKLYLLANNSEETQDYEY